MTCTNQNTTPWDQEPGEIWPNSLYSVVAISLGHQVKENNIKWRWFSVHHPVNVRYGKEQPRCSVPSSRRVPVSEEFTSSHWSFLIATCVYKSNLKFQECHVGMMSPSIFFGCRFPFSGWNVNYEKLKEKAANYWALSTSISSAWWICDLTTICLSVTLAKY